MSIYPVRLKEWYPATSEHYENAKILVDIGNCEACYRGKMNYNKAYAHHSLSWGYGEVWCSLKCLNSNKKGKPDKRQRRRMHREALPVIRMIKKIMLDK